MTRSSLRMFGRPTCSTAEPRRHPRPRSRRGCCCGVRPRFSGIWCVAKASSSSQHRVTSGGGRQRWRQENGDCARRGSGVRRRADRSLTHDVPRHRPGAPNFGTDTCTRGGTTAAAASAPVSNPIRPSRTRPARTARQDPLQRRRSPTPPAIRPGYVCAACRAPPSTARCCTSTSATAMCCRRYRSRPAGSQSPRRQRRMATAPW